jgi:hypothetical protein
MVGRSAATAVGEGDSIVVEPQGWELTPTRDPSSRMSLIGVKEPPAEEGQIRWDVETWCKGRGPPSVTAGSADSDDFSADQSARTPPLREEEALRNAALKCGSLTHLVQRLLDEMLIADIRDVADLMAVDHQEMHRAQVVQALVDLSQRENLTRDMVEATVYFAKLTALRELMLNLGLGALGHRADLINTLQELIKYIPDSLSPSVDLYHKLTGIVPEKGKIIGHLEAPRDVNIAHLLELGAIEAYKKEAQNIRHKLGLLEKMEVLHQNDLELETDLHAELASRSLLEAQLQEIETALKKYQI